MTTLSDKLFGTFLGIEFQEETLVFTFIKSSLSGLNLLSSAVFPLKNDDSTMSEIREFIKVKAPRPDRIFVSIPDKWAITKFITIPFVKGKGVSSIENLMRYEIERHIPYNIEEVAYDFLVIDEMDSSYCVLFVVVHKEKVEYIRQYLESLALRPNTIIPSSIAVLNAIELSGMSPGGIIEIVGVRRQSKVIGRNSKVNVSLYFDVKQASMSVLKDGHYIYHRLFPGRILREPDEFMTELSQTITEVQSRFQIDGYNGMILAGDMTSVPDLQDRLKEKLGIRVMTLDQISDFSARQKRTDINLLASSVGATFSGLGLATYMINLLPHKKEHETRKAVPLSTKIFLVLLLVLIVGIFSTEAIKRKKYLTNIDEEVKKNEPLVAEIDKMSSDLAALKEKVGVLTALRKNEITLELLTEITVLLPKDAWTTSFEYKVSDGKEKKKGIGEMILSGYAASSSALIPILEDSPYMEKVAFIGPVKKVGEKEQFKLGATVTPYVLNEKKAGDEGNEPAPGPDAPAAPEPQKIETDAQKRK